MKPFGFVNRNDKFSELYLELYVESQKLAKSATNQQNCSKNEIEKNKIFGNLVERYSLGFLAKVDRKKLKKELANDWWCFPEKDLEKIEQSIYQTLSMDNDSPYTLN